MSTDNPTRKPFAQPLRTAALLFSITVALCACGGGGSDSAPSQVPAATAPAMTPLFDANGQARPTARHLAPADSAARTRNGLYATRAQFEWEELVAGPYTVLLDIDTFGTAAAAEQWAEQVRGYRHGGSVAYFVRAKNLQDAAQLVNTLADAGFAPVFMVV